LNITFIKFSDTSKFTVYHECESILDWWHAVRRGLVKSHSALSEDRIHVRSLNRYSRYSLNHVSRSARLNGQNYARCTPSTHVLSSRYYRADGSAGRTLRNSSETWVVIGWVASSAEAVVQSEQ
jgi:hypothetical protein